MEVEGCPLPEDRRYDFEHRVWYLAEAGAEEGRIGLIAAFAAFIGPVGAVTFRDVDGPLARGRSVGMLETTRYTGAVRMPVDGRIVARNEELRGRPRLINDSPYDRGWVARIRPTDPGAPARSLETAAEVRERVLEMIRRDRIQCWPATPDLTMFEIGLECSAILAQLNDEFARRPAGTAILLITDDPTSPIEMQRWADQTGHSLLARRRDGALEEFLVRKEEHPVPRVLRRG